MIDLMNELKEKQRERDNSLSEAKRYATEKSQKEREYRVELAKEILRQESNGTKASYLLKLAEGTETVSKLKMELNVAESMYDLARKSIDMRQLDMRIISEQLNMEWHSQ